MIRFFIIQYHHYRYGLELKQGFMYKKVEASDPEAFKNTHYQMIDDNWVLCGKVKATYFYIYAWYRITDINIANYQYNELDRKG